MSTSGLSILIVVVSAIPVKLCTHDFRQFEHCMRSVLGDDADFLLDGSIAVNLDEFRCSLASCFTESDGCRPILDGCEPFSEDSKFPTDFQLDSVDEDPHVVLQYRTGFRIDFHLDKVKAAQQKLAACGKLVTEKLIIPRHEECVRKRLHLNRSWAFANVSHSQLTENLLPIELVENTIDRRLLLLTVLREIVVKMQETTRRNCLSKLALRSAHLCMVDVLNNVHRKLSTPYCSIYAKALHHVANFCDARSQCLSRISADCRRNFVALFTVILECQDDWSEKDTELRIITPYLNCLARQPDFPYLTSDTAVVLEKTDELRSLVSLMREDLQASTYAQFERLAKYRYTATDECSADFLLANNHDHENVDDFYRNSMAKKKRQIDEDEEQAGSSLKQLEIRDIASISQVKQLIFSLNHPFLKYQELLFSYTPRFRHLTRFGHV